MSIRLLAFLTLNMVLGTIFVFSGEWLSRAAMAVGAVALWCLLATHP